MKKLKPISILIAVIILLNGCGAQSVVKSAEPMPSDDGAKEITVEVWDTTNFYMNAAQRFETETGVKVNIINNFKSGPEYLEEADANQKRIQAELMAGKGADIYSGMYLDFIDIGHNGHLCNLADWIAADTDFSDEKYYMNILKSGFDKGNVYSVPLFVMFKALGPTIEVPELNGKSLTWEDFFKLTKDTKRSGILYGIDNYMLFVQRFKDRYDSFIDEKNKTQNLNSTEMIQLLEQCKEWSSEGLCIDFNTEDQSSVFESAFFKEYGGGIESLTNIRFDSPYADNEPYLYDIPSDSGNNDKSNKISPKDFICINAASKYKGTAWKFVKFLLSEDVQATGFDTPVNRKAAAENISKTLTEEIEYNKVDIDPVQAIKETEAILDSVDAVSDIYVTDTESVVFKEAIRYFRNEISAEETVRNMAARMDLYFKEQ